MRVISGSARGMKLETVTGNSLVRPTAERIKEAVFSSIQFDIEGRRILDLFAGSGQMGIEALSRGAESAVFVDSSDVSLSVVKKNLNKTKLSDKAKTVRSDYYSFISRCNETFDIVFLDPPYYEDILEKSLQSVSKIMSDFGIIICEHPKELRLDDNVNDFSVYRRYDYGKISITVYKKGGSIS